MHRSARQRSARLVSSQGQRAAVGPTGAARQRSEGTVAQGKAMQGSAWHCNAKLAFSQWLRGNSQPQTGRQRHERKGVYWVAGYCMASFTTALANLAGANGAGSAEGIVKTSRAWECRAHPLLLVNTQLGRYGQDNAFSKLERTGEGYRGG